MKQEMELELGGFSNKTATLTITDEFLDSMRVLYGFSNPTQREIQIARTIVTKAIQFPRSIGKIAVGTKTIYFQDNSLRWWAMTEDGDCVWTKEWFHATMTAILKL